MKQLKKRNLLKNSKGQGLIEYLVIVALVGIASITLMRTVGQNIKYQFSNVVKSLGGSVEGNASAVKVTTNDLKERDLSDFASGARLKKSNSNKGDVTNDEGSSIEPETP